MKFITIITTTYNREYCLGNLYESLLKQENKNFKWLVIDDGSTDNTKQLIANYQTENKISIQYKYHSNMGMTASRNVGYDLSDTELSVIIDSDDWLAEDAIDKIEEAWNKIDDEKIAGIISLNRRTDQAISDVKPLPNILRIKFSELHDKYKYQRDTKLIYRTSVAKSYPYPVFDGERNFPASYKFRMIDEKYDLAILNDIVCIVDFNENGQTFSRVKQYKSNPVGYAFYRDEMMRVSNNRRFIFKQAIHFVSSVLFSKDYSSLLKSSRKGYVLLAFPVGIVFNLYLRKTKKRSLKF